MHLRKVPCFAYPSAFISYPAVASGLRPGFRVDMLAAHSPLFCNEVDDAVGYDDLFDDRLSSEMLRYLG